MLNIISCINLLCHIANGKVMGLCIDVAYGIGQVVHTIEPLSPNSIIWYKKLRIAEQEAHPPLR